MKYMTLEVFVNTWEPAIRPPKHKNMVLVALHNKCVSTAVYRHGLEKPWRLSHDTRVAIAEVVTHWMQIPDAPGKARKPAKAKARKGSAN